MFISLALIIATALGGLPTWALWLLFFTWIPDVAIWAIVIN